MKSSDLPGARRLYRLTKRALAQIRELWQYAGEDELPPDSLLQAHVEALRILHIDVPLSAKRRFPTFYSRIFPRPPALPHYHAPLTLLAPPSLRLHPAATLHLPVPT